MRALTDLDRPSQLIGRGQALREIGQAVNRCIDDDSGIDGIILWLRTAAEELDSEMVLQKREAGV
jgi:hypothetical protein